MSGLTGGGWDGQRSPTGENVVVVRGVLSVSVSVGVSGLGLLGGGCNLRILNAVSPPCT